MRRSALVFAVLACAVPLMLPVACSDDAAPAQTPDAEVDTGPDVELEDIPQWEAPDSAGLPPVLVLPLYEPGKRCFMTATEIGNYDEGPDGGILPCGDLEVCYERPDGILAYHSKDCVHPPNFKANWTRMEYSDLGPCEPIKHLFDSIKECPNMSCTFARDVVIDTAKSCATAITSKGCRETFGKPTSCFCDGMGNVFLPAKPTGGTAPPSGFTACASSDAACAKALGMVDTVKGCPVPPKMDAGTDAKSDASDATDSASEAAADATDAADAD